MKIIVETDRIIPVIEAIKQLPVQGNFEAADIWVGCVMALEGICMQSEPYSEDNTKTEGS